MAVGMREDVVEITKPRTDKREYRRIVLPNSLEVLLISDPETDKHGGSTNAFTSSEHTNYFFDVNTDCFEEALDRFAQFFIKPLMSPDATMREIKAVDSGSWDTLEVRPKAKGLDTRQELLKFYEENYSANLMHLVIYSKDSLDKSERLVQSKFQEIRNIDRIRTHFSGQPCTPEHLQILVKTVPIKQGHKLRVIWPITPGIRHYMEGPTRYLGHLIGHEGEGSLFYILKKLGWATSLSAGESDSTFEFSFFRVVIDLTDAGHEHFEDIVGLLFKFILLLQQAGPCKWIFDELSAICETGFHYQDKTRPIDYVVNVAMNMQHYPPEDWLVGSSLPSKFNASIIQSFLNELTPLNVRIFWESTMFQGHTDTSEPWYGTAYSLEKIDGSLIQKWMDQAPVEDLHLPAPNVFIPTDLSLKHALEKVRKTLHNLVTVFGYNHKLRVLLEAVIEKIAKFEVKPDRFCVIKELRTRKYKNIKCQQPYEQAMYYCSLALQEQRWSWNDELEVLSSLDADSLARFHPLLLSRSFLECYVAGNIESNEAESMMQHIEDLFYKGPKPISRALFASENLTTRIIELGQGMQYLYAAEGLNPSDENSAFFQYIQVGLDDFELNVRLQLFELIAKQPAFDQLRSVEQLGYITSLSRMYDSGVRGLQFVIQSSVKDPKYVESRVRAFLDMFKSKLSEMSDEEFKKKVNALIDVKLEKFKNIWEEADFFWWEIYGGTYKFDRVPMEVAALKQLTKADLIKFFDEYVSISSPKRKALSVRVYGSSHSSEYKSEKEEPAEPGFVKIEDIFSFRRSRPVYPSFKGNFENKNF
nr:insulin-degrading enzyme-like 1, peroxisomal [Ipomoea batatas]